MLGQALPQIQARLQHLPDEALQPLLSGTNPEVPPFLVMAELERRKQARGRSQETPPGTMVQGLVDTGGIAKFARGGAVDSDAMYDELGNPISSGTLPGNAPGPSPFVPDIITQWNPKLPKATRVGTEVGRSTNLRVAANKATNNVVPAPAIPAANNSGGGDMSDSGGYGGLGNYDRIVPTEVKSLDEYRTMLGDAPQQREITDGERDAAGDRLRSKYGYDFTDEKATQVERKAGLAKMKSEAGNLALLKLGTGLMASKRTNFFGALGEAADPTIDYYTKAQAAAREEQRAIQSGDLQIARAANAEKLQMLQLAGAQLKENQGVQHNNALAKSAMLRDALTLRQGDIAQRSQDQRLNVGLAADQSRERAAIIRAGLAARADIKIPPHLAKDHETAFAAALEKYNALATTLQQRRDGKGKQLTPQELEMLDQLSAPGAAAKMAMAEANAAVTGLPSGPYNGRGGLGSMAQQPNEVDMTGQ